MRIVKIIISIFVVISITATISYAKQNEVIATVKTKSGKEYSFITQGKGNYFRIAEWHKSSRGYMIGSGIQHFNMFDIDIDVGDFVKVLKINDVTKIKFIEIGKSVFKISVETKKNKTWHLSLQGEYLQTDKNDGIEGTEKEYGEIKIPFVKIDSISIIKPGKIYRERESKYKTKAVTY